MKTGLLWAALVAAAVAQADDRADITAIIEKYRKTQESGDLIAQSQLMTADRVGVWGGKLRARPALEELKSQMQKTKAFNAHYPGIGVRVEIEGLEIRQWGDTAAATFRMHTRRTLPASLSAADAVKLSVPVPTKLFVHTLVKQAGVWRIAVTAMQFVDADGASEQGK